MKEEQIINAARELFKNYGFKKVSMDEIARKAGVTKKTVYKYFASKQDLLKFFINEELINMKKIIEDTEKKNSDFFECVHECIFRLLQYKHKRKFLKVILEEAEVLKDEKITKEISVIDEQIQKYIKEKLKYAVKEKYIDVENIDIAAFLIYKMYIALMFDCSETYKKLDDKVIADSILKFVLNGISRKEDDK